MKKVNRYELDFERAINYVKENLDGVNILSQELLDSINLKQGFFFTLLPEDAHLDRIYEFKTGGVLQQNPTEEYFISGTRSTFSEIPTIQEELAHFILKRKGRNLNFCLVFDDVTRYSTDEYLSQLYDNHGFFYKKEVYYFLTGKDINFDLTSKCIEESNAIWHSLCVLANFDLQTTVGRELSIKNIQDICLNTELLIVGAYDGEGYVFWERNQS